jgi:radical SAM protein with 4Fe4S-binding SPASM domain
MGVPLILFSGGEPLLRHDIWKLAEYARGKGIQIALSTNGTLINPETAKKIKSSGIGYAGISLDGATADTHDTFRGVPGAFCRTVAAFRHCLDAGVRCGVRVTLTKENFPELGALIDLARNLGASRFCLYWLVPSGRGNENYSRLQLSPDEVVRALELIYRKAKEADSREMEFLTVDSPQDCIHLLQSMEQDRSLDLNDAKDLLTSLNGGCSAGNRVANVDPLGNVYPCQFARSSDFFIGNIRRQRFSDLWKDNAHPVLSQFRERPARIGGRCGSCRYMELCGGGCRVRARAINGNFLAEDPFCFVGKTDIFRQ